MIKRAVIRDIVVKVDGSNKPAVSKQAPRDVVSTGQPPKKPPAAIQLPSKRYAVKPKEAGKIEGPSSVDNGLDMFPDKTETAKPVNNEPPRPTDPNVLNLHYIHLPPTNMLSRDYDASAYTIVDEKKSHVDRLVDIYEFKSKDLFFNKRLLINETICQICEVEFYQYPDPYMPIHDVFKTYGSFYIDDLTSKLYLTCGNDQCPGGILIKSIYVEEGKILVEGSKSVVEYLKSLKDLDLSLVDRNIDVDSNSDMNIWNGPRTDLTLEVESTERKFKYVSYVMTPFRFACRADELKLGKHYFAVYAKYKGMPESKIIQGLKLKRELLGRWTTHFINGQSMYLEYFLTLENCLLQDIKTQLLMFGFYSNFL